MKTHKRFKSAPLNQPALIKTGPEIKPGSFDVNMKIKLTLSDDIRHCGLSRYEICAKVSELTGHELTKAMLDQYTAESREDCSIPARLMGAVCHVIGSFRAIDVMLEPADAAVVSGDERQALELMRIDFEIRSLERRKNELRVKTGLA